MANKYEKDRKKNYLIDAYYYRYQIEICRKIVFSSIPKYFSDRFLNWPVRFILLLKFLDPFPFLFRIRYFQEKGKIQWCKNKLVRQQLQDSNVKFSAQHKHCVY